MKLEKVLFTHLVIMLVLIVNVNCIFQYLFPILSNELMRNRDIYRLRMNNGDVYRLQLLHSDGASSGGLSPSSSSSSSKGNINKLIKHHLIQYVNRKQNTHIIGKRRRAVVETDESADEASVAVVKNSNPIVCRSSKTSKNLIKDDHPLRLNQHHNHKQRQQPNNQRHRRHSA